MLFDITTEEDDYIIRYESNISPRVGDILTLLAPAVSGDVTTEPFDAEVLKVEHHLVKATLSPYDCVKHNLSTIVVRII
jgi:hypothetical protein